MRDGNERKGGGIMIILKNTAMDITEIQTKSNDILALKCSLKGFHFDLICAYLSVNEIEHNKAIYSEINKILKDNNEKPTVILVDFNAHVGFLGPQRKNRNGELLLNLTTENNLAILNGNPNTQGKITWSQGERESVIDYILASHAMLAYFDHMNISYTFVINTHRNIC